jgi:hypothetical protein
LAGIVADQRLNEMELLFLDSRLRSQEYFSEGADVLAILSQVGDILEDGLISLDELRKMQARIEQIISDKGSEINSSINKSVNYLVIGTLASRDWLYSSHGRKIEKALLLKCGGSEIRVITEPTLLKYTR